MKKIFVLAMAAVTLAAPFANAQEWPRHHRDRPDEVHRKMPPRGPGRPGWGPYRGKDRSGYYHGYRGYRDRRPGYRRHSDGLWYPAAAFALGAIIGGALNN
ncbi:hypothetical protein FBZ98_108201 [Rhizobium sp. ERR 922]|uniref:Transmembrane protein n=1 Tax=Rhizobium dioscoreae TaxID=2653122 RepID=A0ABQ0Z8J5_9HYPH|nr:hypothetical protein [Rhizobium sp. AG207R]TWB10917.1 hypothetical protein FBZ99_110137 [Rhizobium sp. ERR1071]TWB48582.1 hypothetical protein FBZ98_108201 [Rhizobium sp. ERR 922]TWB90303.1 hypothetical protein FBZ97_109201 [Rhizobium sp. ERR 942]GES41494.1 hypothetical protein RsS62_07460 [Rhizobium dioscoreae]GLU83011.1 hypothetical protein Rhsp01_41870 [Rhizobium sp. NBRC 114257]